MQEDGLYQYFVANDEYLALRLPFIRAIATETQNLKRTCITDWGTGKPETTPPGRAGFPGMIHAHL